MHMPGHGWLRASNTIVGLSLLFTASASMPVHSAMCEPGAYGSGDGDFVVVVSIPQVPPPGQRYLFRDGRRGSTADASSPVACDERAVTVRDAEGRSLRWPKLNIKNSATKFSSVATTLAGELMEPLWQDGPVPLVVMVHGSERTPAIGSQYAYALAAQGIAVFVYDKRGTGASQGEYTQNFELLADDAVAALAQARAMMKGRFSRAGYFGGSQGGWVAPLAATRSRADFVAVGFGLVASPIEEDHEQMLSEATELGLGADARKLIDRLSRATASLLLSGFTQGFQELTAVRRDLTPQPWVEKIRGEHSGDILRMSEADLRRVGRARFDNLELIWDYDALAALKKLDSPLLWVLAGEDREAPIERTREKLQNLAKAGKRISLYLFPHTDHGMVEFTNNSDGSRSITRITDGYLRLLADWIKGNVHGSYGRAEAL
jgi:pimeloyl-ACP methyl ester carboxylesterase